MYSNSTIKAFPTSTPKNRLNNPQKSFKHISFKRENVLVSVSDYSIPLVDFLDRFRLIESLIRTSCGTPELELLLADGVGVIDEPPFSTRSPLEHELLLSPVKTGFKNSCDASSSCNLHLFFLHYISTQKRNKNPSKITLIDAVDGVPFSLYD